MKTLDIVIPAKNAGLKLLETINLWLTQQIPPDWQLFIYLVDDGSVDHSCDSVKQKIQDNRLVVFRNERSQGRSKARNMGASLGYGNYIAFFDADCQPNDQYTLTYIINIIEKETPSLVFGKLLAKGVDFWNRYFNKISQTREQNFLNGNYFALTSAHLTIRRDIYRQIGGFDESYKYYGFEDRDLLIRAYQVTQRFRFQPLSIVNHVDKLNLKDVCRKMKVAGIFTSKLFRERHPVEYKKMAFSKVDYRELNSIIRIPLLYSAKILLLATWLGDLILKKRIPFKMKVFIVQIFSASAFLVGSWYAFLGIKKIN